MPDAAPVTTHRLAQGDARLMPGVAPGSAHLVVTSPPYPMVEMWDEAFGALSPAARDALARGDGWAAFEAMHAALDDAWAACARALADGGFLCVNVGDATRTLDGAFALYPNHARVVQACVRLGLTPLPAVLWRKQTNAPTKFMGSGTLPAGAYVTLEHELVLIFRKGARRAFDAPADRARRRRSAFFWEERNQWFSDLWDFKGERQALPEDADVARRSAAYPLELPYRLVAMLSVEGDVVLDPFCGTGTTSLAALALGRHSVGLDLDPALLRVARGRLAGALPDVNARGERRLADHVAFVRAREARGEPAAHANATYGFPVVTSQETDLRLLRVDALREARPGEHEASHSTMPLPAGPAPAPAARKAGRSA